MCNFLLVLLPFWKSVFRNAVPLPLQPVVPSVEGLVRGFVFLKKPIFWVFKCLSSGLGDESNLGETLTPSSEEARFPSFMGRQWRGLIAAQSRGSSRNMAGNRLTSKLSESWFVSELLLSDLTDRSRD